MKNNLFPIAAACFVAFFLGGFWATTQFIQSWDEIPEWCYEKINSPQPESRNE